MIILRIINLLLSIIIVVSYVLYYAIYLLFIIVYKLLGIIGIYLFYRYDNGLYLFLVIPDGITYFKRFKK